MLACVRLRPRPFRLLSRTPDSASPPPRPLSASLLSVPACRPSLFRFAAPAVRHLRAFRPRCTTPPWGSWVCLRSGLQEPLNPSDRNPHDLLRKVGLPQGHRSPSIFPGGSRGSSRPDRLQGNSRKFPGEYPGAFRDTSRKQQDLGVFTPNGTCVLTTRQAAAILGAIRSVEPGAVPGATFVRERYLGLCRDCIRNCSGAGGFLARTP